MFSFYPSHHCKYYIQFVPQMGDSLCFLVCLSFSHDSCPNQCALAVVQEATDPPYVTSRFMISAVSSVSGELAEVSCK